jgi:FkbM family methyltransferase
MTTSGKTTTARPKNTHPLFQWVDTFLRTVLRVLPASSSAESIALWWGYKFRPNPRTVKLRSGPSIYVDPSEHLSLLIYYLGTFEPYCLPHLRRYATKGTTVIDVGANIGVYTLESAVIVGPDGGVISIEPAPPHVSAIKSNLQINNLGNVHVIEAAVSDAPGQATLTLPKGANLGMFTLGGAPTDLSFSVKLRTIDSIVAERCPRRISVIKMDIEGSEYRALLGAERTITTYHPAILIELNDLALGACGSSSTRVKSLLQDWGYSGSIITRNALMPIPNEQEWHNCDECLFFYSPPSATFEHENLPTRASCQ